MQGGIDDMVSEAGKILSYCEMDEYWLRCAGILGLMATKMLTCISPALSSGT